ncbi:unnamed protein product [Boreogadus saida]
MDDLCGAYVYGLVWLENQSLFCQQRIRLPSSPGQPCFLSTESPVPPHNSSHIPAPTPGPEPGPNETSQADEGVKLPGRAAGEAARLRSDSTAFQGRGARSSTRQPTQKTGRRSQE